MSLILALIFALRLEGVEVVALRFAGCQLLTRPGYEPGTVVVKWVCPN
jgi:hypothetical protein